MVGPPIGAYTGMPTDTVDVAAGFPVDAPIEAAGEVVPFMLPGGPVVELLHRGSYADMGESYDRVLRWVGAHGAVPGELMWESYLTEPDVAHPEAAQTLICWPVIAPKQNPA